ncbi:hypothetical protein F4803DRAFT_83118 [Xylaria telfairii]|nr:hypothetical protein F4803DRAFT_83118 [Xylaria telfairii]
MSSSTSTQPALKPLFTREILTDIEASLAENAEYIELKNAAGKTFRSKNLYRGIRGALSPGEKERRNIVGFHDERNLKLLDAKGKAGQFFPVYNATTVFQGATKTEANTRKTFAQITQVFEASNEAAAITELIHTQLSGCAVNKVIAFGLGRIGNERPGPSQTFYEHVAAKVVWKAVKDVSSTPNIALLVQEPLYTDVCKKVLREFGFNVVGGFGALGFTLIDDDTVVLGHHPSFPLREIISDIARPALISMRAQDSGPDISLLADADSVRSRKMLEGYRSIPLPVVRQRAFWENTWYVRDTNANPRE